MIDGAGSARGAYRENSHDRMVASSALRTDWPPDQSCDWAPVRRDCGVWSLRME